MRLSKLLRRRRQRRFLRSTSAPHNRARLLEQLEDRRMLATFDVDSIQDAVDANRGDGICDDGSGNCTLRAAVMETNALQGDDTINLPAGDYALTIPGRIEDRSFTGDLDVSDTTGTLTITGGGAASTTIAAERIDRVLEILAGANLVLTDVTITRGDSIFDEIDGPRERGGGIRNDGRLEVADSAFSGNVAKGGSQGSSGGAIFSTGTLTVRDTMFSDNTSVHCGGAIHSEGTESLPGTTTLTRVTFQSNSSETDGGGFCMRHASATLTDITFENNQGGGLNAASIGALSIQTSTFTGNIGDALDVSFGGPLSIVNSTFTGNLGRGLSAAFAESISVEGSTFNGNVGRGLFASADSISVDNSNFTGNSGGISTDADQISVEGSNFTDNVADGVGGGLIARGMQVTVRNSTFTGNRATTGGGGLYANLANRPAATLTIANTTFRANASELGGGAIYITEVDTVTIDDSTLSENTAVGDGGAVFASGSDSDVTVSNTTFTNNDAGLGGGAILSFGGSLSLDSVDISFNTADHSGGIANTGSTLTVADSTISNNHATSSAGGIGSTAPVVINDSAISSNFAGGVGGGILAGGPLHLTRATVRDNTALGSGGGISSSNELQLHESTVVGNTSFQNGGGFIAWNGDAERNIVNTTVSGNRAAEGGGIWNSKELAITNSTIVDNAALLGGGVLNFANLDTRGDIEIQNSIVANNRGLTSGPDIDGVAITSLGNNLIGQAGPASGFQDGTNNDQVGGVVNPIDPLLGPLTDSGGPTLTHALLSGSPAIDAANDTAAPATDQRGEARPEDGDGDNTATADIGAFEFSSVEVDLDGQSTDVTFTDNGSGRGRLFDTVSGNTLAEFDARGKSLIMIRGGPADERVDLSGLSEDFASRFTGEVIIEMGLGSDTVVGSRLNEKINLGPGNNQSADAGEGDDDMLVGEANSDMTLTGSELIQERIGPDETSQHSNFERFELIGTPLGDTLDASAAPGPVTFRPNGGPDNLLGGPFDDTFIFELDGNPSITGGNGIDLLYAIGSVLGDDIEIRPDGAGFEFIENGIGGATLTGSETEMVRFEGRLGDDRFTPFGGIGITNYHFDGGFGGDEAILDHLPGTGVFLDFEPGLGLDKTIFNDIAGANNFEINQGDVAGFLVGGQRIADVHPNALDSFGRFEVDGMDGDDGLIVTIGQGNSLTVDYNGGPHVVGDDLTLNENTSDSRGVEHLFTGPNSGTAMVRSSAAGGSILDGDVVATIFYDTIEPIFDNVSAENRVFIFGAGDDDIRLEDDIVPTNNKSKISSVSSSETVEFTNPTLSLSILSLLGDDTITLADVDPQFEAAILAQGGLGNDTIDAATMTIPVILNGGLGDDTLTGGAVDDILIGGPGTNTVDGGGGNNITADLGLHVVDTDDDVVDPNDDFLSLREAIDTANSNNQDDVILVLPGDYQLQAGSGEDGNATGDLDLMADNGRRISIVGFGSDQTTVNGFTGDRVFDIHSGATAIISDLTVTGGSVSETDEHGGGIRNQGRLTLANTVVTGNESQQGNGGGVFNVGSVVADSFNTATFGAVKADVQSLMGLVGGTEQTPAARLGKLTEARDLVQSIVTTLGLDQDGVLTSIRSDFSGNRASGNGGGLFSQTGTVITTGSSISQNQANHGGGVQNEAGIALLTNSTLAGNQGLGIGGGLNNESGSKAFLLNATVSGNRADRAGGIHNQVNAVLGVLHGTIANNTADNANGQNNAGGLLNSLTLGVDADGDGIPDDLDAISTGYAVVQNTIISGNSLSGVPDPTPVRAVADPFQGHDISGAFLSNGGNFIGDATGQVNAAFAENAGLASDVIATLAMDFGLENLQVGFAPGEFGDHVGGQSGAIIASGGLLQANPIRIGSPVHGLKDGDRVTIFGLVGDPSVNGRTFPIIFENAAEFSLPGTNAGFAADETDAFWQQATINPRLLPLADNGGPTLTHALAPPVPDAQEPENSDPGSPAIDAARTETALIEQLTLPQFKALSALGITPQLNGVPSDQRSLPRPIDGNDDGTDAPDIGAYEFGVFELQVEAANVTLDITHTGDMITVNDQDLGLLLEEHENDVKALIVRVDAAVANFDTSGLPAGVQALLDIGTATGAITGGEAYEKVIEACGGNAVLTDGQVSCDVKIDVSTINMINQYQITAGDGNDTIDASDVTAYEVICDLLGGDDVCLGGALDDQAITNGNDRFEGGLGNDSLRIDVPDGTPQLTLGINASSEFEVTATGADGFVKTAIETEKVEIFLGNTGVIDLIAEDLSGEALVQEISVFDGPGDIAADGDGLIGAGKTLTLFGAEGDNRLIFNGGGEDDMFGVSLGNVSLRDIDPVNVTHNSLPLAAIASTSLMLNGNSGRNDLVVTLGKGFEQQFESGIAFPFMFDGGGDGGIQLDQDLTLVDPLAEVVHDLIDTGNGSISIPITNPVGEYSNLSQNSIIDNLLSDDRTFNLPNGSDNTVTLDGGGSGNLQLSGDTITRVVFADSQNPLVINDGDGNGLLGIVITGEPGRVEPQRVVYNGEGGTNSLQLDGGQVDLVEQTFNNASEGQVGVIITGEPGKTVDYTGLAPIFDNLDAVDRVFNFPPTDDDITFNTGDSDTDNILRIDSDNSEVVDFVEPSGSITINYGAGEDVLLFELPSDKLPIMDGGLGENELRLTGADESLDLGSIPDAEFVELDIIDIAGSGNNTLTLELEEVQNISASDDQLSVLSDLGDTVNIGDGWDLTGAQITDGEFFRVLEQAGATLFLGGPADYQNPIAPLDADDDGFVVPTDVLITITEQQNRRITDGTGQVIDPVVLANSSIDFNNLYPDIDGDGFVVPLDTLLIINFVTNPNPEGESGIVVPLDFGVNESASDGIASHEASTPAFEPSPPVDPK
jgi:hypothetical protein